MSTFNELIDFTRSTTGTYLDSVVYGDELVTNGTFATDSDWIKDSGWTISNGQAQCDGTDGAQFRTIDSPLTDGKTYYISYEITAYTSGDIRVLGQGFYGISGNSVSTVTGIFVATKPYVRFYSSAFNGSIDNVSVKEVIGGQVSGTPLLRTAAINEPRLEYDASGNPLGLLIEEARTNVLAYSEGFTSGWSDIFCFTTANAIASPDGAVSGAKLQEDSSGVNGPRFFPNNNAVLTANQAQTLSCFFKAGTSAYAYLTIRHSQGNVAAVEFDLTSGTVNSTTVFGNMTLNGSDITSVGNGWYKCSVTATSSASTTSGFYLLAMTDGSGVTSAGYPNYALTGKNIYAWGAQLEEGAFPTSYIPTSGSTVTRAADFASASSFKYHQNSTQGTLYVAFTPNVDSYSFLRVAEFGYSNLRFSIQIVSGAIRHYTRNAANNTNNVIGTPYLYTLNSTQKTAFTVSAGYAAQSTNGTNAQSETDVLGLNESNVGFYIGRSGHLAQLNGHIKQIQYYPKRLSNAQLQALTS